MNQITEAGTTILMAVIGVAIVAIIISKKSNTSAVVQSLASGFGNILNVAISPVTGNDTRGSLAYPQTGSGFGIPGLGM